MQLEAEVVGIDENKVLVHFNGWDRRFEEHIEINSPRLAPFRTHTVQSAYSHYMSPTPTTALDSDPSQVQTSIPHVDDILEGVSNNLENIVYKMNRLMEVRRQREEVIKMIELFKKKNSEKGYRLSLKGKKHSELSHHKGFSSKKGHKINQREIYNKEETNLNCETHSNFSSRVQEREYTLHRDREDVCSMKSLKINGEHKRQKRDKKDVIIDKDKDLCDTISAKSFKSHKSGISMNSNFVVQDYISEESSEQYPDELEEIALEEEEEKNNNISQLEEKRSRLDAELYHLTGQLAPLFDRMGRCLVDSAPHIAMMTLESIPHNANNMTNMSLVTNEGSIFSNNLNLSRAHDMVSLNNEQYNRILNPTMVNRARFQASPYTGQGEEGESSSVPLHVQNGFLNFEIPVMLSPGELLNTNQRGAQIGPDTQVHLHVQAHVPLPSTSLLLGNQVQVLQDLRQSEPAVDKAVQTEALSPHNPFSYGATISERNGSDFDMGSLRGSMFETRDRKKIPKSGPMIRLNPMRANSQVALLEPNDSRDITFRRSEENLSDDSNKISPKKQISHCPDGTSLVPDTRHLLTDRMQGRFSPNASEGELSLLVESPGSIGRLKSKTVSFKIDEHDSVKSDNIKDNSRESEPI